MYFYRYILQAQPKEELKEEKEEEESQNKTMVGKYFFTTQSLCLTYSQVS